jgi:hypothetical protein
MAQLFDSSYVGVVLLASIRGGGVLALLRLILKAVSKSYKLFRWPLIYVLL